MAVSGERARDAATADRWARQRLVSAWLDVPLSLLALLQLGLIIAELTAGIPDPWKDASEAAQIAIWLVFLAAFVLEVSLAPSKRAYLRTNWLTAIAVAVPALRVLRVARGLRILRSARALRHLTLVRTWSALRRVGRDLADFTRASQFVHVLMLTVLVTVTSAALAYAFERDAGGATIVSFGDALWWASTVVTTVNAPQETVTLEGRLLSLALRVFGLTAAGYLTARLAVFLLGRSPARSGTPAHHPASADDLAALRSEIRALREELAAGHERMHDGAPPHGAVPHPATARTGATAPNP